MILHHYFTPESSNISSLARITSFAQNLDGYAILAVGKKMLKWYPTQQTKLLIHLSDGWPGANGYGGQAAINHVRNVNNVLDREGVKVIGVGIDEPFNESGGTALYGPGNFVITKGDGAYTAIANLISNTIRKTVADASYV